MTRGQKAAVAAKLRESAREAFDQAKGNLRMAIHCMDEEPPDEDGYDGYIRDALYSLGEARGHRNALVDVAGEVDGGDGSTWEREEPVVAA